MTVSFHLYTTKLFKIIMKWHFRNKILNIDHTKLFSIDLQKILEDCDKDHSETITFEEFKDGMKSYMEFFLHE